MRVFKDTPFEFGYVVWQIRPPQPSLTLVIKGTFDVRPGGVCTVAEEQSPCTGEVFFDDDAEQSVRLDTDLAILKPRAECFLAGTCHAPNGTPTGLSGVTFRVGAVQKRLAVFGDRHWEGVLRGGTASQPEPFTSMPLRYERSLGGVGFDKNPLGKGIEPIDTPAGRRQPLPNVEDPARLVSAPSSRPDPAGFSPIPRTWKARMRKTGTYDKRWVDTRWPWFPVDFDIGFFNAAPADQQIDGFWKGDEEIHLQHLHPTVTRIDTRLPGVRARGFVEVAAERGTELREVPLKLDTITVDADTMKVHCLWRGVTDVRSEALHEVQRLFYFHEPLDAYATLDEARGRLARKLRAEMKEEKEFEATEMAFLPREPPAPPATEEDPEAFAKALDAALTPLGVDFTALKAEPPPAPEQKPSELRQQLTDAGAEIPDEIAALQDPEPVHEVPPEVAPTLTRDDVVAHAARRGSFAGMDLSGLDLSGLDFSEGDFADANLQRTVLRGCMLRKARFDKAVMVEADLSKAFVREASFVETDLERACGDGSNFQDGVFDDAHLDGSSFREANFAGASLKRAEFPDAHLDGSRFYRSVLDAADLQRATASGCDFREASIQETSMERITAEGSCFDGANLSGARFSEGAHLATSTFRGAVAPKSQWAGAILNKVDFAYADLTRADFTAAQPVEANFMAAKLRKACFRDAVLVGAVFIRADVFHGTFEGADLSHADMTGANLFGAQLWRANTQFARFDLADVGRTHLEGREG